MKRRRMFRLLVVAPIAAPVLATAAPKMVEMTEGDLAWRFKVVDHYETRRTELLVNWEKWAQHYREALDLTGSNLFYTDEEIS